MADSTARLFIGSYPPRAISRALLARLARLPDLASHRPVPESDVHLTVYFIGERPRDHVPLLARGFQPIVQQHSSFTLTVDRLVTIPARRPRLIAARAQANEPLARLNYDLCRLFEERAPSGKSRMDLPHLTLCRFQRGVRTRAVDRPIELMKFEVSRIHLVESVLAPTGATHTVLESFELARS